MDKPVRLWYDQRVSMSRKALLPLWVACLALLAVASCSQGARQFYDDGVSDEEYITIASAHPDAQAFLQHAPQAETYVDRSSRLAVDFRVTRHQPTSTTEEWAGIRLRVFLDPETKQPAETLVQCNNTLVEDEVQQVLEHYFSTQACP